jgi:integration host factor subunit alpha
VTKADIVEQLANANGFSRAVSRDLVESVLSIAKETLTDGEMLKISGFGSFIVKEKNECRGRNLATGEEIRIDARRVLTFKPSVALKNAINGSNAVNS